jgi:hypothetical protein
MAIVLALGAAGLVTAIGQMTYATPGPPCDEKPDLPACRARRRPDGDPPCDEKPELPACRAKT